MAGEYSQLSLVVLEWQAQARAEGRAEGRAEARAEGRAEARAEMLGLLREKLLTLMRTKSQAELPAALVSVIQRQTDPAVLLQWYDRAVLVSSVEELRNTFGLS